MKSFFYTLPANIVRSFWGRNILWHIAAAGATLISVISGFDWSYFLATRPFARFLFPAVTVGWYVPVLFPAFSYVAGSISRKQHVLYTAYATAQAVIIGLFFASFYKAFTGRPGLRFASVTMIDNSREFHFGFWRGGIFFGWPSSHTTIAFAMASAICMLNPESKTIRYIALFYAFYIGLGVSMTIHWFSDFAAGALIGSAIGSTTGRTFGENP